MRELQVEGADRQQHEERRARRPGEDAPRAPPEAWPVKPPFRSTCGEPGALREAVEAQLPAARSAARCAGSAGDQTGPRAGSRASPAGGGRRRRAPRPKPARVWRITSARTSFHMASLLDSNPATARAGTASAPRTRRPARGSAARPRPRRCRAACEHERRGAAQVERDQRAQQLLARQPRVLRRRPRSRRPPAPRAGRGSGTGSAVGERHHRRQVRRQRAPTPTPRAGRVSPGGRSPRIRSTSTAIGSSPTPCGKPKSGTSRRLATSAQRSR